MEHANIEHCDAYLRATSAFVKGLMDCPDWFADGLALDSVIYRSRGSDYVLADLRRYLSKLDLPEIDTDQWASIERHLQRALLAVHAGIHPPAAKVIETVVRYLDGGTPSHNTVEDVRLHYVATRYAQFVYEHTPVDQPEAVAAFNAAYQVMQRLPTWVYPTLDMLKALHEFRDLLEAALASVLGEDWNPPRRASQSAASFDDVLDAALSTPATCPVSEAA